MAKVVPLVFISPGEGDAPTLTGWHIADLLDSEGPLLPTACGIEGQQADWQTGTKTVTEQQMAHEVRCPGCISALASDPRRYIRESIVADDKLRAKSRRSTT